MIKLSRASIPFQITFVIIITCYLSSCKKSDTQPDSVNTQVPTDDSSRYKLIGTWHMVNTTYQYFEFTLEDKDSFYNMLEQNMRVMDKEYCRVTKDSIFFQAVKYAYSFKNGQLKFSNGLTFERVDSTVINHKLWQKPVIIEKVLPLPHGFETDFKVQNFGINGDTIYYWHKSGKMMCYNMKTDEYLDSFVHPKYISQCIVDLPYFYYYIPQPSRPDLDTVFRSLGFKGQMQNAGFTNIKRGAMSYDPLTTLFYFHEFDNMYYAQQGMPLYELSEFDASYVYQAVFYKQNLFLLSGGFNTCNQLSIVKYQNGYTQTPVSYTSLPGYNNIRQLATDGENIWVSAQNHKSNKYELVKVKLEL